MSQSNKPTTSRRDFLSNTGRIAAASTLLSGAAIPRVYAGEDNTIQVALVGCGLLRRNGFVCFRGLQIPIPKGRASL